MRATRIDMLLVLLLALLGCQRESAPGPLDAQQQHSGAEDEAERAPSTPASTSRLQFDTWDFGVTSPGTELRHRYTIRNNTARPWTIKEVTPSCSCTCGEFTSRTVKPAESTSVEVVFRAGNRDGDIYQAVLVEFAETVAPLFQLAMKGEVRGLLSPSPPSVDFGRVSSAERLSRSLHLRNYSDQDITVTKIEAPDWLQIEIQPAETVESGNRPRQTWKITAQADLSRFHQGQEAPTLVVHTNAVKIDPVVIPVHLEIRPPLEVVPNRLDFRIVPVGRSGQQALILDVSSDLGDLTEKDLVLTHNLGAELEIRVFKIAAQNRFRLTGIFLPKGSRGAIQGELEIRVRGQVIRVPISGSVR